MHVKSQSSDCKKRKTVVGLCRRPSSCYISQDFMQPPVTLSWTRFICSLFIAHKWSQIWLVWLLCSCLLTFQGLYTLLLAFFTLIPMLPFSTLIWFNRISSEATYRSQSWVHTRRKKPKTKTREKNNKSTHTSAYFLLLPNVNPRPLCINNYSNHNLAAPCPYICVLQKIKVFISSFGSFLNQFHLSSCHLVYLAS